MSYGQVNTDIVSDSSGGRLAPISSVFRNRIINGSMTIDQRNSGASVTPTTVGAYTYSSVDRLWYLISQSSKFTIQQNAGAITPPNGFSNYVGVTSSAATSVGSGDYFWIGQSIEGFNTSDFSWGTANAKTVTLSAWVYSSLTGTFGGSLYNSASNYFYPFTYTISSANTWTQISITVTGPTSGTWVGATNGVGVRVLFNLGSGSTYTGTANAWASGSAYAPTGAVNVVSTSGATFYITGVQLEVGSSATGYEYVNYQTSLANCQRYFQNGVTSQSECIIGGIRTGGSAQFSYPFKVTMRSTPSITLNSFTAQDLSNGSNYTVTGLAMQNGQTATNNINMSATWSSGGTAGVAANLFGPSNATGFTFSAEL